MAFRLVVAHIAIERRAIWSKHSKFLMMFSSIGKRCAWRRLVRPRAHWSAPITRELPELGVFQKRVERLDDCDD